MKWWLTVSICAFKPTRLICQLDFSSKTWYLLPVTSSSVFLLTSTYFLKLFFCCCDQGGIFYYTQNQSLGTIYDVLFQICNNDFPISLKICCSQKHLCSSQRVRNAVTVTFLSKRYKAILFYFYCNTFIILCSMAQIQEVT